MVGGRCITGYWQNPEKTSIWHGARGSLGSSILWIWGSQVHLLFRYLDSKRCILSFVCRNVRHICYFLWWCFIFVVHCLVSLQCWLNQNCHLLRLSKFWIFLFLVFLDACQALQIHLASECRNYHLQAAIFNEALRCCLPVEKGAETDIFPLITQQNN